MAGLLRHLLGDTDRVLCSATRIACSASRHSTALSVMIIASSRRTIGAAAKNVILPLIFKRFSFCKAGLDECLRLLQGAARPPGTKTQFNGVGRLKTYISFTHSAF
jgi:hypothetical protein